MEERKSEMIDRINKFLQEHYGLTLDGKPRFRVVWSDSLFETRKGMFEKRTPGGIYLGTFEGIAKAPKYTYIKDRWILEVNTHAYPEVFGGSIDHKHITVLDSDGYEPLRVFMSKKAKGYIVPDMDIVKLICDAFSELINRPQARRLTESIVEADEKRSIDAEVKKFFEILNGDDSTLMNQFHDREAVIYHREDS